MVYTNIAQGGIVGDIEAPLLRVVPVEREHWTYQCTQFNSIQYLPLSQKHKNYFDISNIPILVS